MSDAADVPSVTAIRQGEPAPFEGALVPAQTLERMLKDKLELQALEQIAEAKARLADEQEALEARYRELEQELRQQEMNRVLSEKEKTIESLWAEVGRQQKEAVKADKRGWWRGVFQTLPLGVVLGLLLGIL